VKYSVNQQRLVDQFSVHYTRSRWFFLYSIRLILTITILLTTLILRHFISYSTFQWRSQQWSKNCLQLKVNRFDIRYDTTLDATLCRPICCEAYSLNENKQAVDHDAQMAVTCLFTATFFRPAILTTKVGHTSRVWHTIRVRQ